MNRTAHIEYARRNAGNKTPTRPSATSRRAGLSKRKAKRADQINIALFGSSWD